MHEYGDTYDTLWSATCNAQHLPLTVTDAAGQATTYTYNTAGQVLTVTTPERAGISENRTTTYVYDADGYLRSITGPATGATTSFTYDDYGRVETVTSSDGDTVTYDYDDLDRLTLVTYPDTTYEETVYERLDPVRRRDRLGRWTETSYDALRRVVATRDAEGRTTSYLWCDCGSLTSIQDPNGTTTSWDRDEQGRVIKERRADSAEYQYTYESATSRLKEMTDAQGQVTQYAYNIDDTLASVSYRATIPTPTVGYTYDPEYNRLVSMTDGIGATSYAYHPAGVLGAGRLSSVDGPLADDTVSYAYDELGRVISRGLPTFATTAAYDSLGRIETVGSPVGDFTWGYDGVTSRPLSLDYPNGQATSYAYLGGTEDRRLQQIQHRAPGGAVLSQFEYTYDVVGNIGTWQQQYGANPATLLKMSYDAVDQLTAATKMSTDAIPVTLKRHAYAYDPAGNRTAEQIDDAVTGASYNNMNQLTSQQAGGALVFKGTVSEPATVTVGGQPATVTVDNRFEGQASVPQGTGQVQVTATDPSGNVRTSTYEVSQAGAPKTFTYDLNGNMTSDGTRTYEWDAENRLVAVKEGATTVASFTYNRRGLRTSKTVGAVRTDHVLEGRSVVEERQGGSVTKHFQGPGVDNVLAMQDGAGVVTYLTRDHLGSIREHVDATGTTVTLRRDYDPWGNISAGAATSGWAYTGRENNPEISLHYYRARYYDSKLGRFTGEDPAGGEQGNRFLYASNNPVTLTDPLGLRPGDPFTTRDAAVMDAFRWLRANARQDLRYEWGGRVCQNTSDNCFCATEPITDYDTGEVKLARVSCAEGLKDVGEYHTHPPHSPEFSDQDKWAVVNRPERATYIWVTGGEGAVLRYEWVWPGEPVCIGNIPPPPLVP